MRTGILTILLIIILLTASGCGLILPKEAGIVETERTADEDLADVDVAEEKQETTVPEQTAEPEPEEVEEVLPVSGSLNLQTDQDLCPHLARTFSCDKYDLRWCDYTTMMGGNGFYPNVLNCRDGDREGQTFCLIQSCMPLTEGNIVYAYGGITAYAEYTYTKEKIEGGIMLHHTLVRCGETTIEFETQDKCRFYRSTSGLP